MHRPNIQDTSFPTNIGPDFQIVFLNYSVKTVHPKGHSADPTGHFFCQDCACGGGDTVTWTAQIRYLTLV